MGAQIHPKHVQTLMHVYTIKISDHVPLFSVTPSQRDWDGFSQASHGPQYTFREMKWHKHNLQDFSPHHWALNIVNSCVKVSVVVIYKHAQRDLLFDKRSRSKCHLTERFWELPWSSVFVTMETDKQCFLWEKKGGQLDEQGRLETEQFFENELQHLIGSLFLPFSLFFPLYFFFNISSALLCLLFYLSAWRMVIFDTAQLWHYNQHFPSTMLPTRTWTRNK